MITKDIGTQSDLEGKIQALHWLLCGDNLNIGAFEHKCSGEFFHSGSELYLKLL